MKVMLVKDVFKLGRAGDVKKVADGYGRNFLLPQRLAVLATPGALKQVERIRAKAEVSRNAQNEELRGLSDQIEGTVLTFSSKAGETGKLYGSITTQNIADALQEKVRFEIKRHQVEMQPIRNLGEYVARIRLTIDLIPQIKVLVHREGEALEESESSEAKPETPVEAPVEETPLESMPVAEIPAAEMVESMEMAEAASDGQEGTTEGDIESGTEDD